MKPNAQDYVIDSYRRTFEQYGNAPEAVQWSAEGQRWRFDKLLEIAAHGKLQGKRLLEIGCGLGHFYPHVREMISPAVDYTGIDIVPEMIAHAKAAHPEASFECRDIFQAPITGSYDYVFISGVFNAPLREDSREFLSAMIAHAFAACRIGLAFNFTSSHVNFVSEGTNYFDPCWVLSEVLEKLSKKVVMHHHYRNCDVAVFVYR